MADKRVNVSFDDLLAVVKYLRDDFPTLESAAKELKITPASLKARLKTERERYPAIFDGVADYPLKDRKGRQVLDEDAAAALDAKLAAKFAKSDEGEDENGDEVNPSN